MSPDSPMIIAAQIGPTPEIVVNDVADAASATLTHGHGHRREPSPSHRRAARQSRPNGHRWGRSSATARAQHAHSRCATWGHIDHVLAGSDELLSEQVTKAVGGLDRPRSLPGPVGPLTQPGGLGRTRPHPDLVEYVFVAVDRDSGVGAL